MWSFGSGLVVLLTLVLPSSPGSARRFGRCRLRSARPDPLVAVPRRPRRRAFVGRPDVCRAARRCRHLHHRGGRRRRPQRPRRRPARDRPGRRAPVTPARGRVGAWPSSASSSRSAPGRGRPVGGRAASSPPSSGRTTSSRRPTAGCRAERSPMATTWLNFTIGTCCLRARRGCRPSRVAAHRRRCTRRGGRGWADCAASRHHRGGRRCTTSGCCCSPW